MSVYGTTSRGERSYLGNSNTKEVHYLPNEKPQCQIDEILAAGHAVGFSPDTLDEAKRSGYDKGHWCIGGSTR